ncbi:DUF397 domain-containing protein [Streptomyces sp. NPDC053048]|uniref:DUF397 domain-containing protein n=1 Tax=Streptomyces sp. NPDC053048 TaxID=3365694 RepID=UPI0037CF239A
MTSLNWQKTSYSAQGDACLYLAADIAGQKSSYSGEGDACVYVNAAAAGTIHLRESDAPDVILTTTPQRLRPLISGIKAGTLDRAAARTAQATR